MRPALLLPMSNLPQGEDGRQSGSPAVDGEIAIAMRDFLSDGNAERFEQAVAEFVRGARSRGVSVEQVVASLEAIADTEETSRMSGSVVLDRTRLRRVLLRGVLLAFYGIDVVHREEGALQDRRSQRRRHDDDRSDGG